MTDKSLYYQLPSFDSLKDERRHLKERLAAAFRLFGRFGFSEGVAGHITARDPEHTDCFWVNPFGMPFTSGHPTSYSSATRARSCRADTR